MLDTVIIGSGPAGLAAAIYASRAALNYVVLEKAGYSGGQIVTTNDLDNYPGMPNIDGASFSMALQEHAEKLGAEIKEATVTAIKQNEDNSYTVEMEGQEPILTKSVVLATGANPRTLNVPGEQQYLSRGVYYCATCDGAFYRNKTTAVIGGGNTALEDVLFLAKICEKVYLIHRREGFRAEQILVERINELAAQGKVEMLLNAKVTEYVGDDLLSGIVLDVKGERRELPVNGVFVAIGYQPATEIFAGQLDLDEGGYIKVGADGKGDTATSCPGVFAAGDCAYPRYHQAIVAAGAGCKAALDTEQYLLGI